MTQTSTNAAHQKRRPLPWRSIKRDYLHGEPPPTMAQLAAKYECSESAIRKRSARERWPELREEMHVEAEHKINEQEIDKRSKEYAEWDKRHLSGAAALYAVAAKKLSSALKKPAVRTSKAAAAKTEDMSAAEIEKCGRALKTVMEIERTVHGRVIVPDDQTGDPLEGVTPEQMAEMEKAQKALLLNEAEGEA